MECLVKKLVLRMEKYSLISPDQSENYTYVLQIKLECFVTFLCLLLLSCFFRVVTPTIFFLFAVAALKKRCGGFHAKTFLQCLGSTIIIYTVFVKWLLGIMLGNMKSTTIIFFSAFLFVETIGATNHPNMNWNRKEFAQSKEIARMTAFIETLIIMLLLWLKADQRIIVFLMFAMMLSAFLLILAKIFREEVRS